MPAVLGLALRAFSGGRGGAWVPCPSPAEALRLDKGSVHIWMLSLRSLRTLNQISSDADLLKLLSSREAVRARGISQALPRSRYINGRAALRTILSRYEPSFLPASLSFENGPQGKPYLAASSNDTRFNVSQTGDMYVAAIAGGVNVGVDIESSCRHIRDVRALAARWLHPEEAAYVGEDSARLLQKWTQKEAVVKANGRGIGHGGMRGFCVNTEGMVLVENGVLPDWRLFEFRFPSVDMNLMRVGDKTNYFGCVAVESPTPTIDHWFYGGCDELVGLDTGRVDTPPRDHDY